MAIVSLRVSLAGAAILLIAFGCRPDTTCQMDGAPCGGDPTGTWTVIDACRDPFFARPLQTTYLGQPVEMARQPNPTVASSDWCSAIFFGGTTATAFTFPHDTLAVSGGQLTYASDGTFQAVIDTAGPGGIDLSLACLTRSGGSPSCDMVAAALADFAAVKPAQPGHPCSDSPGEPPDCRFYNSYQDIRCADLPAGGCRCTYSVSFTGTVNGRWSAGEHVLNHFEASKTLPSQADYCVDGSGTVMTLGGHNRTSLFEQDGIHTLALQRTP